MPNSTPVICFHQLEKNYGSLKVLRGVSGEISKGEVVSVIGASGCGKSTLLRCFNRLETINGGRLEVLGIDLSGSQLSQKVLREVRSNVGMVFQQFNLFPHLSVRQNLMLATLPIGKEMSGTVDAVRHGNPPRLKAERGEFGLKEAAYSAHTLVIHGPAIEVGDVFEKGQRLIRMPINVTDNLLLDGGDER